MEGSPPRRKPRPAAEPTLESLPTEILENIVARLSIREAIRTSAVSRAWRRRWESTPNLRFRWSRNEVDVAVIGPVLARYSCPIRSFWTGWVDMQDSALTDEWVVLLAEGRVESISLGFAEHNFRCFHTIHSAIFSCCELTELELENCHLPAAPSGFGGFPNLTRLELSMVTIPEHGESTLEAIISSATMLRCLNLKNVFADGDDEEWEIRAPNLKHLTIESDYDCLWKIEEFPFLETATIIIDDDADRDFVQILTCFAQVRSLELYLPTTEDNALGGLSCSFEKLKNLTLHTNFRYVSSILCTFSLLTRCPNIEDLDIEIRGSDFPQNDEIDAEFFNTLGINDLFANLDDITLRNTPCLSNEMHFIEFVLSRARLLRKFSVFREESSYSKPSEETAIELAKYRRASPKARVLFRTMDDYYI